MDAGAGVGVGDGMGGICLPIYPSQEVHVLYMYCTQRSVESEHLFFGGEVFSLLFFGSRGGTCSSSSRRRKVFWFFLYLPFFGGGVLVLLLLLLLLGSTWLSLSFFPGRASLEEGRGSGREERKERKAV